MYHPETGLVCDIILAVFSRQGFFVARSLYFKELAFVQIISQVLVRVQFLRLQSLMKVLNSEVNMNIFEKGVEERQ
jgi:hypothetical protein